MQFISNNNNFKNIAMALVMAMFFYTCKDQYEKVGDEAAELIYPQGVAEDFELVYSENPENMGNQEVGNSRVLARLLSNKSEDYDNLKFPYRTFPDGLKVVFYDENQNESTLIADYAIIYSATNLIDLQGNVTITTHDGKVLETPQLYWDRVHDWIFTQARFTYTNPDEGTIMDGEGMDFNRDFSFLTAHKTDGIIALKD